jgi:hypothetical protein
VTGLEEVPMVVAKLKRLTTGYDQAEDRIRITGETDDGHPVVIWMTNRLARRAVPRLVQWLEKEAPPFTGNVRQSFAQEAAVAGFNPQKPVAAGANAKQWIAQSLDLAATERAMTLTFRRSPDESAAISFDSTKLRQWLSILHRSWMTAEWSPLVWPDWIKHEESTSHDTVIH